MLDAATGRLECSVLIKGFQFEKALMQDHFNENYMESHKFPKGVFKGTITNMQDIHLKKDGTYTVVVKGDLPLKLWFRISISKFRKSSGIILLKK